MARLPEYEKKRDFSLTPEPAPGAAEAHPDAPRFVVHKHHARRLHYDLRLEIDGALASWSVPRGPSYDPKIKRLAVQTEDHPLEYGDFEGRIPDGQYGAGDSLLWDRGLFDTVPPGQVSAQRKKGHVRFVIQGEKLHGEWHLVRTTRPDGRRAAQGDLTASGPKAQWLLFKAEDADADPSFDVIAARPESVLTGRVEGHGPGQGGSPPNAPKPSMPALLHSGVLGAGGDQAGAPILRGGPLFAAPHPERLHIDVARPAELLAMPASLFGTKAAAPAGPRELVLRIEAVAGSAAAAAGLARLAEVAGIVRGLFAELGLASLCSVAGPRALHVRVALAPGHSPGEVERFARRVAETLARSLPGVALAGAGPGVAPGPGGAQPEVLLDAGENLAPRTPPELLAPCAGAPELACAPLAWDELTAPGFDPALAAQATGAGVRERCDQLIQQHRASPVRLPPAR